MVGVFVSERDSVDDTKLGTQQLSPQIRRRVNQQDSLRQTDHGGTAESLILRR